MKKPTKYLQLQIPEPCAKKWENMTPEIGGRHCDSCSRTIVDFTNFTDAELARYYLKHEGKLCGHFRLDQMGRSITLPTPQTSWERWRTAGIVASGLLLSQGAVAQSGEQPPLPMEVPIGCGQPDKMENTVNPDAKPLTGTVTDSNGEPLIGASIMVVGMHRGTVTDIEGKFHLERTHLPTSFALEVSYMGYETQVLTIGTNQDEVHDLEMKMATHTLEEAVVVASSTSVKGMLTGILTCTISSPAAQKSPIREMPEFPEPETPEVLLYPNPFISTFQLNWNTQKAGRWTIRLINAAGQELLREQHQLEQGLQQLVIDTGPLSLPAAQYFIRMDSDRGESHVLNAMKGK